MAPKRPTLGIYSRSTPAEDKKVVEIDGRIADTRAKVLASFDHHRSGNRVNLDDVPDKVHLSEVDELVTPMFDTDFLISAIVTRMGGKEAIKPTDLKVLYAASEWCDLLESDEEDEDLKQKGLGLHLYLKGKGFGLLKAKCEEKGEMANGRFNASDETMSEIANELGDELESALQNGTLDDLQDMNYLQQKEPMQQEWREANEGRRNDELMASVVLKEGEYIDPIFFMELLKGKLCITSTESDKTDEEGRRIYNYTVSLKPSSYEEIDLRPLIDEMNKQDPNVIKQAEGGVPESEQKRWGGREVVFGAPFGIHSALSPDEVEQIVEDNIDKCKKAK